MRAHQQNPKIRQRYEGLTDDTGNWTGCVRFQAQNLVLPLKTKKPTIWAIWNDLFHEGVTDRQIDFAITAMALTYDHTGRMKEIDRGFHVMVGKQRHIYILLTKRVKRMEAYFNGLMAAGALERFWDPASQLAATMGASFPGNAVFAVAQWIDDGMPGLWPGVTVEHPDYLWRLDYLLRIPAEKRILSVEPMLGPVDLTEYLRPKTKTAFYNRGGVGKATEVMVREEHLDWVVCGGETGPGARPLHPDWVRGIRNQCVNAGAPFFFKQWGEYLHESQRYDNEQVDPDQFFEAEYGGFARVGKRRAGYLLDGQEWRQFPIRDGQWEG